MIARVAWLTLIRVRVQHSSTSWPRTSSPARMTCCSGAWRASWLPACLPSSSAALLASPRLLARNAALAELSESAWAARRPARKSAAADASFAKVRRALLAAVPECVTQLLTAPPAQALAKAQDHGFFLGMELRWAEE